MMVNQTLFASVDRLDDASFVLIVGISFSGNEIYKDDGKSCVSQDQMRELQRTIQNLQDQIKQMQNGDAITKYPPPDLIVDGLQ